MKYINLVAAVMMGVSFAVAAPAHAKNPIQSLAVSLDAAAHAFLEAPSIPVPGNGSKPTSIPMLIDGALIETLDVPSNITCDYWVFSDGVTADSVRKNIEQLRGRPDKPRTLPAGTCEIPVCDANNSGIGYCVGDQENHNFTFDNWGVLADAAQALLDTCSPNNEYVDAAVQFDDILLVVASNMPEGCGT